MGKFDCQRRSRWVVAIREPESRRYSDDRGTGGNQRPLERKDRQRRLTRPSESYDGGRAAQKLEPLANSAAAAMRACRNAGNRCT